MSIATELENYATYLGNAYSKATEKGATIPTNKNLQNLTNCIDSIPTGTVEVQSKDVDFLDYDGTILYSYTATEFANLSALPDNPTHDGLTSQGWNWTLADAKTYVAKYGFLDIGQNYMPSDEKTHVYIQIDDEHKYITTMLCINGTVKINWGDNTEENTLTGTSASTLVSESHTYQNAGYFCVTYQVTDGYAIIKGASSTSRLIEKGGGSTSYNVYRGFVKKIEIGKQMYIEQYACSDMYELETITFPATAPTGWTSTKLGQSTFSYCSNLRGIVFPPWVTGAGSSTFAYAGLHRISMSKNFTYLYQSTFAYCFALERIALQENNNFGADTAQIFRADRNLNKIAFAKSSASSLAIQTYVCNYATRLWDVKFYDDITTVSANAFSSCNSLVKIDFSNNTAVPTLSNTNAFSGLPTEYVIVVPDTLYDNWIATSNWSSIATHIIKASQA